MGVVLDRGEGVSRSGRDRAIAIGAPAPGTKEAKKNRRVCRTDERCADARFPGLEPAKVRARVVARPRRGRRAGTGSLVGRFYLRCFLVAGRVCVRWAGRQREGRGGPGGIAAPTRSLDTLVRFSGSIQAAAPSHRGTRVTPTGCRGSWARNAPAASQVRPTNRRVRDAKGGAYQPYQGCKEQQTPARQVQVSGDFSSLGLAP